MIHLKKISGRFLEGGFGVLIQPDITVGTFRTDEDVYRVVDALGEAEVGIKGEEEVEIVRRETLTAREFRAKWMVD